MYAQQLLKRALSTLAILFGAATVNARDLYVMPIINIGRTVYASDNFADYALSVTIGLYTNIGLYTGYMFTRFVGVCTDINYTSYQWSLRNTDTIYYSNQVLHHYFEVPIYVRFVIGKPNHIGVIIRSGLSLGFLNGVREKVATTSHSFTNEGITGYVSTSFAAQLGLGIHIPVNNRIAFNA